MKWEAVSPPSILILFTSPLGLWLSPPSLSEGSKEIKCPRNISMLLPFLLRDNLESTLLPGIKDKEGKETG